MPNPGFLFAEDAALKRRLSTLSVTDDNNSQRVPEVRFGYPEGESEKTYPFVTIDLLDIAHAPERQESERSYAYSADPDIVDERAYADLKYFPSEMGESELEAMAGGGILVTDQFVPVDLVYQVITYTRNPIHDRQLHGLILRRVFPLRRGFIEIPEDGTMRRLDLVDWRSANVLDQETGYKKRIFRKVYTVTINAEIPQSDLLGGSKVLSVHGELTEHNPSLPDSSTPPFTEDF